MCIPWIELKTLRLCLCLCFAQEKKMVSGVFVCFMVEAVKTASVVLLPTGTLCQITWPLADRPRSSLDRVWACLSDCVCMKHSVWLYGHVCLQLCINTGECTYIWLCLYCHTPCMCPFLCVCLQISKGSNPFWLCVATSHHCHATLSLRRWWKKPRGREDDRSHWSHQEKVLWHTLFCTETRGWYIPVKAKQKQKTTRLNFCLIHRYRFNCINSLRLPSFDFLRGRQFATCRLFSSDTTVCVWMWDNLFSCECYSFFYIAFHLA